MTSTASRLLTIIGLVWLALLIAAPVMLAHGFVVLPAIVYEAAGLICHQKPERSFHLLGIQLPVCARCFGLYASGAAGACLALAAGASPRRSSLMGGSTAGRIAFAVAALPTAGTVALEWAGLIHPSGMVRALAAIPLGALAGWVFVRALSEPRPLPQLRYHS